MCTILCVCVWVCVCVCLCVCVYNTVSVCAHPHDSYLFNGVSPSRYRLVTLGPLWVFVNLSLSKSELILKLCNLLTQQGTETIFHLNVHARQFNFETDPIIPISLPPHTIDPSYWYSFQSSQWDKSNGTCNITLSHKHSSTTSHTFIACCDLMSCRLSGPESETCPGRERPPLGFSFESASPESVRAFICSLWNWSSSFWQSMTSSSWVSFCVCVCVCACVCACHS